MPLQLEGRTALVTGSVQGIGLGIGLALAATGARVALHGIAGDPAAISAQEQMRAAGAAEVEFFPGDLRVPREVDALMDAVMAWRPLDILVNNAGIQRVASVADADRASWDEVIAVNLSAAFQTMHRALPAMAARGYGRVVNIASVHGLVGSVHKAPYVASKFGLIGLSRVAALEYAASGSRATGGVTVNCICPGATETAILDAQVTARAAEARITRDAAVAGLLTEKQPSRRLSMPEEVGDLAVWLCGRSAHNVTGTAIPIDGGWTAQ